MGYVMDGSEGGVVRLSVLSAKDTDDVFLFGTMITGQRLIGSCFARVY